MLEYEPTHTHTHSSHTIASLASRARDDDVTSPWEMMFFLRSLRSTMTNAWASRANGFVTIASERGGVIA